MICNKNCLATLISSKVNLKFYDQLKLNFSFNRLFYSLKVIYYPSSFGYSVVFGKKSKPMDHFFVFNFPKMILAILIKICCNSFFLNYKTKILCKKKYKVWDVIIGTKNDNKNNKVNNKLAYFVL